MQSSCHNLQQGPIQSAHCCCGQRCSNRCSVQVNMLTYASIACACCYQHDKSGEWASDKRLLWFCNTSYVIQIHMWTIYCMALTNVMIYDTYSTVKQACCMQTVDSVSHSCLWQLLSWTRPHFWLWWRLSWRQGRQRRLPTCMQQKQVDFRLVVCWSLLDWQWDLTTRSCWLMSKMHHANKRLTNKLHEVADQMSFEGCSTGS